MTNCMTVGYQRKRHFFDLCERTWRPSSCKTESETLWPRFLFLCPCDFSNLYFEAFFSRANPPKICSAHAFFGNKHAEKFFFLCSMLSRWYVFIFLRCFRHFIFWSLKLPFLTFNCIIVFEWFEFRKSLLLLMIVFGFLLKM